MTSTLLGTTARRQKRTAAEEAGIDVVVKKTDRAGLDAKAFMSLTTRAKEVLLREFTMLNTNNNSTNELQGISDVGLMVEQFRHALRDQDMADVFTIADEFDMDSNGDLVPATTAVMVDLLTQYNEMDLETIKQKSVYYWEFGADYHVANLKWSRDKPLNSCKATLRYARKSKNVCTSWIPQCKPNRLPFIL